MVASIAARVRLCWRTRPRGSQHERTGHHHPDQNPADRVPVPGPGHLHRCRATDATLLEAIERTRPALDAAGVTVSVTKTLVASETQAQALGFVSSPTIRINGLDIAGELVESACDSCSETCACNGGVDCRDWLWRGEHSHEPPLGLIVEAIMRHAGRSDPASPPVSPPTSATVPANLRQYFAATGADSGCCGDGVAGAACGCQA
jgi:uncharacterized protein DUF2703